MTTTEAQVTIEKMVRLIVEKFDPIKIILFGSYARGTAGPDSDVDLMVIMPVTGSIQEKRLEIRVALNGMGIAKDIAVYTPEQVAKYKDIVGTIIYPASREGKVLYERTA
jgi:predicted nucleotidyltransferase